MASLKERVTAGSPRSAASTGPSTTGCRTQEHYGEVQASQWAGAVTYFGFLSIFPILALAFFFVGYISKVFPDAQDTLVEAINSMLPGIIGDGDGRAVADRDRRRGHHGRDHRSGGCALRRPRLAVRPPATP